MTYKQIELWLERLKERLPPIIWIPIFTLGFLLLAIIRVLIPSRTIRKFKLLYYLMAYASLW